MLELAKRYGPEDLSDLVYHRMGLLALSDGQDSEMTALLESRSAGASFAMEFFCRQVRAAIGSLAAKAGGIDALVFTGGIGEHAFLLRFMICGPLAFLGFKLTIAPATTTTWCSTTRDTNRYSTSPADEESMICKLVRPVRKK
jgi:acetate kinase